MNNFEYFPINWVEGMHINASHFINTENFLLERIIKATAIAFSGQYGILPNSNFSDANFKIENVGNKTQIFLKNYYGICPNGFPILIDEKNNTDIHATFNHQEGKDSQTWDIVLTVFPYQREPTGTPDPNEMPLRYPNVQPQFQSGVIPTQENASFEPFSVIVGVLKKINNNEYGIDHNYIPPSLSMDAHENLKENMLNFLSTLDDIESKLKSILSKIQTQPNHNSITESLSVLCKEMLRYIASINYILKNNPYQLSPFVVCEKINGLVGCVLSSFTFISKKDKEELLKYFQEWNGVLPASFEQMFADFYATTYNHNRIQLSMYSINFILQNLKELLTKLSQLEFVGQHKESIVISESRA